MFYLCKRKSNKKTGHTQLYAPSFLRNSSPTYLMMLGIYGIVAKTISRLPPIKLSYQDL